AYQGAPLHGHRPPSNGERFLLGLIQKISPASGVSFANDTHMINLLRHIMQSGDLRAHLPHGWRGKVSTFEMARGAMDLKGGETLDPQGKIKALLEEFRLRPGEEAPSQDKVAEAMVAYLASGRDPAKRLELQRILFKRAAASTELREKLD